MLASCFLNCLIFSGSCRDHQWPHQDLPSSRIPYLLGYWTEGNFLIPHWANIFEDLVQALARAGSYLDGGAAHVLQDAAVPLLKPDIFKSEMKALQQHFVKKRDFVLKRQIYSLSGKVGLTNLWVDWMRWAFMWFLPRLPFTSGSTVLCLTAHNWRSVSKLPEKIHSGLSFFEACLEEKVIVVPGMLS